MKYTLDFEIKCGKKTCASSPGEFCRFIRNDLTGKSFCHLFGEVFENEDGWIQRHNLCLERAKEKMDPEKVTKTIDKLLDVEESYRTYEKFRKLMITDLDTFIEVVSYAYSIPRNSVQFKRLNRYHHRALDSDKIYKGTYEIIVENHMDIVRKKQDEYMMKKSN